MKESWCDVCSGWSSLRPREFAESEITFKTPVIFTGLSYLPAAKPSMNEGSLLHPTSQAKESSSVPSAASHLPCGKPRGSTEPKTSSSRSQGSPAQKPHLRPPGAQPCSTPTTATCSGQPVLWQTEKASQSPGPNHPPVRLVTVAERSFRRYSVNRDEVPGSRKIVSAHRTPQKSPT